MIQFCGDLPVFGNAEEMIEGFVENPSDLIRGSMVIALSVSDLIQCRREQLAASRNLALDVRQAVFDAVLLLCQLEQLLANLAGWQCAVGGEVNNTRLFPHDFG
ncbi:hypothetical protein BLJ79_21965 [Arthrobacter sp. UCD-GKA]|nr:hypothetical protein BLJ79_21965 [Arthrobacter sp. UCD-GKA]